MLFLLALPFCGYGQEKVVKLADKTNPDKVLQESQEKKKAALVKSVPVTNKTMEVIRLQNKKATKEQIHTINKAIRKSMTIHKRR